MISPNEALRVGNLARAEGMPWLPGMAATNGARFIGDSSDGQMLWADPADEGGLVRTIWRPHLDPNFVPDIRDRVTAKAFEVWVEIFARGHFGDRLVGVTFSWSDDDPRDDGHAVMVRYISSDYSVGQGWPHGGGSDTGPEACIAAVCGMRSVS